MKPPTSCHEPGFLSFLTYRKVLSGVKTIMGKAKVIASFTVVLISVGMTFAGPTNAETIRMAWFAVPPHVTVAEDGVTPQGPTITLFNAIAQKMGCTVDWHGPLPLNRLGLYQERRQSEIDGTILHIKTPAILPYLYYPKEPYLIGKPSIAVRVDDPLTSVKTIEDIQGYRIGFVKTFSMSYPAFIKNNLDKVAIDDLTGENWTSRNLAKLLSNRLDAVYERNQYTLGYQAIIDDVEDRIRILELPVEPILHYFVFHKNSDKGKRLLELYEKAVAGMTIDYDGMVRKEMDRLRATRQ
ncbi:hypothetical protein [uncultured Desulfosarcina sp.]|uniref:substrate-binding periplasmic protein n=1 Tax=uncultured Desulfosarcina sp. TaxID=218289 RepID=UPI0029C8A181|nr:hypothetical protein [uncultured Desulfosarcina sp.]